MLCVCGGVDVYLVRQADDLELNHCSGPFRAKSETNKFLITRWYRDGVAMCMYLHRVFRDNCTIAMDCTISKSRDMDSESRRR